MSSAKTTQVSLNTDEQRHVAARSNMYRFMTGILDFPDEEFFNYVNSGDLFDTVSELTGALSYKLSVPDDIKTTGYSSYDEFSSDYIKIFDVGVGGPPCPLYEGFYYLSRQSIMEELIRFYEYFDLDMNKEQWELPDHISVELEFMHFLTFKEAGALSFQKDPSPYRRAQRDFLGRHLLRWLKKLDERLLKINAPGCYRSLVEFMIKYMEADYLSLLSATDVTPS